MDFSVVTKNVNQIVSKVDKHSPEILVISGIIGFVGTTILACKATSKSSDIFEEHKAKVEIVKNNEDSEEEIKKNVTMVYCETVKDLVKVYGPAIICGAVSVAAILSGTNILRSRNVALAAAYATVDKAFKSYRGRVIERFGEEVDKELRYNITKEKITETEVVNGKEKKVKKDISVVNIDGYSDYARFFDEASEYWEDDSEMNLMFLKAKERYCNDLLVANGHLYLNEVYDELGIPRTKAGQIVGWVYDNPNGDNYVDFGIYQTNRAVARDFVNGYEKVILLDFNVDGNILDLM